MTTASRLTRIERRLIEAEYQLDSTLMHVRKVHCDDVKPLAARRFQKALNAVRACIVLLKNETGTRQYTLFGTVNPTSRGRGKAWLQPKDGKLYGGHTTPHRWKKDCQNDSGSGSDAIEAERRPVSGSQSIATNPAAVLMRELREAMG